MGMIFFSNAPPCVRITGNVSVSLVIFLQGIYRPSHFSTASDWLKLSKIGCYVEFNISTLFIKKNDIFTAPLWHPLIQAVLILYIIFDISVKSTFATFSSEDKKTERVD